MSISGYKFALTEFSELILPGCKSLVCIQPEASLPSHWAPCKTAWNQGDLALAMEIKSWFTGDAHTSRHPRPVSLALLGSHPHLGDPYQMTRLSNNSTIIFNHYFSTFVWSAVYIAGQRGLSPSRQKVLPPIGRSLPSSFLICLIDFDQFWKLTRTW